MTAEAAAAQGEWGALLGSDEESNGQSVAATETPEVAFAGRGMVRRKAGVAAAAGAAVLLLLCAGVALSAPAGPGGEADMSEKVQFDSAGEVGEHQVSEHHVMVKVCGVDFKLFGIIKDKLEDGGLLFNVSMRDRGHFVRNLLLKIDTDSSYRYTGSKADNGMHHEFGKIEVKTGTHVRLLFSFWDTDGVTPLTLDTFHITWYDLDQGPNKHAREYVVVGGPHLEETKQGRSVWKRLLSGMKARHTYGAKMLNSPGGKTVYFSKYHGTYADNPDFPKELSVSQKRRVAITRYSAVHQFKAVIGSTRGAGSRGFLFALFDPNACVLEKGCSCLGRTFNHGREGIDQIQCGDTPQTAAAHFRATCLPGYELVPHEDQSVVCEQSGEDVQWNAEHMAQAFHNLQCRRLACSPADLKRSLKRAVDIKAEETAWGQVTTASYSCEAGYEPDTPKNAEGNGEFEIGCELHGHVPKWSSASASCVPLHCDSNSLDSQLQSDTKKTAYGEYARVNVVLSSCDVGYQSPPMARSKVKCGWDESVGATAWEKDGMQAAVDGFECVKASCSCRGLRRDLGLVGDMVCEDVQWGSSSKVVGSCGGASGDIHQSEVEVSCVLVPGEGAPTWDRDGMREFNCPLDTCTCEALRFDDADAVNCPTASAGSHASVKVECSHGSHLFSSDGDTGGSTGLIEDLACHEAGPDGVAASWDSHALNGFQCQAVLCMTDVERFVAETPNAATASCAGGGTVCELEHGEEVGVQVDCELGYEPVGGPVVVHCENPANQASRFEGADFKCSRLACHCSSLVEELSFREGADVDCEVEKTPWGSSNTLLVDCPEGLDLVSHGKAQDDGKVTVQCALDDDGKATWQTQALGGAVGCSRTHEANEVPAHEPDTPEEMGQIIAGAVGTGALVVGGAALVVSHR